MYKYVEPTTIGGPAMSIGAVVGVSVAPAGGSVGLADGSVASGSVAGTSVGTTVEAAPPPHADKMNETTVSAETNIGNRFMEFSPLSWRTLMAVIISMQSSLCIPKRVE
jgi:hypothetical protein